MNILFCVFVFALASCVKVENEKIITESLPYKYTEIQHDTIAGSINKIAVFYDSLHQSDFFEVLTIFDKPQDNNIAYCIYCEGFPSFDQDQITFTYDKYKNVKNFIMLPVRYDYNGNKTGDEAFLLVYSDSVVLQIHDHHVSSNTPYFKHKFLLENGHKILFLGQWLVSDTLNYLVFRKMNRLTKHRFKEPDSLIFINVRKNFVKTIAVGVPTRFVSYMSNPFLLKDTILTLQSWNPRNGHHFGNLKDYNAYLLGIDRSFHIKWVDTLFTRNEPQTMTFNYFDSKNDLFYLQKSTWENPDSLTIFKVNKNTGEMQPTGHKVLADNIVSEIFRYQNGFISHTANEIIIYDSLFKVIKRKKLPVSIKNINNSIGYDKLETKLPTNRLNVDINKDGFPEILVVAGDNQLVVIDGKILNILAASKPSEGFFSATIVRIQNNGYYLSVGGKDFYIKYKLEKQSFLTRLSAYFNLIFVVIFLLFILPLILIISYRLLYLTKLFRILTVKSNFQGVAIYSSGALRQKIHLKKYNDKYLEILQLDIKSINTKNGMKEEEEIIRSIRKCLQSKQATKYNLSISNHGNRYITLNVSPLIIFGKVLYCVATVTDTTDIVKSELLTVAISIAHDAKNELAEVQNRIENLFYVLRTDTYDKQHFENDEKKIRDSINEIVDTLTKLLFTSNIHQANKKSNNLKRVIDNWIENKGKRYSRDDIQLINNIEGDIPDLMLDEQYFFILLQCAADNAKQAMQNRTNNKQIIFEAKVESDAVQFSIKDNGCGLDEKQIENILHSNYSLNNTGTGLGMKLIKKVCNEHDGELLIKSKIGVGTDIIIILPRK